MHRQLELWPASQEEPSQQKKTRLTLDYEQQKQVITALASLISKMVCSDNIKQTQEENHER